MAIYHFHAQVISRSTGRSAVACAAYRSGERLYDERYDKDHDYTKKEGVVHQEILLPEGAPVWMSDREQLWNAVESHEKRKDAQLAREFNVSLPRELTRDQNIQLIREFVKTHCVDQGMVADVCVHDEVATDGQAQLHAHVMLTMRHVDGEGFGQKARDWNDKSKLLDWREAWAEVANRQLALNGHDHRIDHRTLEAQGIALEPQHRIGANSARDQLAAMADHERIARENGERLLKEPTIVLDALSRQQSTFTSHDIARTINRYTVDAQQFQAVHAKVLASDELKHVGQDEKGRDRYTTKTLFEIEKKMMHQVEALSTREAHTVNAKRVEQALSKSSLSDQQKDVLKHMTEAGDARCVIGYAGTGKSTMLKVAREVWEGEGYRVRGMTLSGIAAQNLQQSSGIESRTIASWCYRWDQGTDKLTSRDVLIIDEAGMVGSRQLARLVDEVHAAGAKVILTGDTQQFQAIEAGAAFRAATERVPTMELTEVWRQKEEWQREATKEFAQGRAQDAFGRYEEKGCVHDYRTQDEARGALLARWDQLRREHPTHSQIVLTYTRAEAKNLNELIRAARQQGGELGPDHVIQTERGDRNFAAQDRIYFLKNDSVLDVKNGTLGTITAIQGETLTVCLDQEQISKNAVAREVRINLKEYNQLDHGYAATLHKGQGVTVDHGLVLGSKYMDAHATYVGATRHRHTFNFFWSREEFSDRRDLIKTLSRERQKDMTIDYLDLTSSPEMKHDFFERSLSPFKTVPTFEKPLWMPRQSYEDAKGKLDEFIKRRNDLSSFKTRFESEHPDLAKETHDHLRRTEEKQVLEYQKQRYEAVHVYQRLDSRLQQGLLGPDEQNKLTLEAKRLLSDPTLMAYAKALDKTLVHRIGERAKQPVIERDLDRGGR